MGDSVVTLDVGKEKIAKDVLQSNGVIGVRWNSPKIAKLGEFAR